MGQVRDLKEAINGVLPQWSHLATNFRGIPLYVDQSLTGISRFSRKTGATVGLINPDVESTLVKRVAVNQSKLELSNKLKWFQIDGVVKVEKELLTIDDYDIDAGVLTLKDLTRFSHELDAKVFVWSVPTLAVTSYTKGTSTIQLRTKDKLMIGDYIAFRVAADVNVFKEIRISNVVELTETVNPFNLTWEITLETPTFTALALNEIIQLRAYPAYFSEIRRIPNIPNSVSNLGPFVFDKLHGRITAGKSIETGFVVQLYDKFKNKLKTTDPFEIVDNFPISDQSIQANFMLFWDLMFGQFKQTPTEIIGVCDSGGTFGATKEMQPNLFKGNTWKLTATSTNDAKLNISFEPNAATEFDLAANTPLTITVGTGLAVDIERITVTVSSDANAEVKFSDWQLNEPEVEKVSYSIMAKVITEATWLSTGLIVKPLFISADYLSGLYDEGNLYNGGLIYR